MDFTIDFRQSNYEGDVVEACHEACCKAAGIVINPAALSFTSPSLVEALREFGGPKIEVHISNVHARDSIYHHSQVSKVVTAVIAGLGFDGYEFALEAVRRHLDDRQPSADHGRGQGILSMQIGWCAPLAEAPLLERLGYDYIEVPLAAFGLEDAASVQTAAKALADCPLPTPAFGYFLPRDMPIVGPRVDTARVRNYLAYAAELMALAGGKVITFGSGWARTPPPDWPPASTEQQLIEFLSACGRCICGQRRRSRHRAAEPQGGGDHQPPGGRAAIGARSQPSRNRADGRFLSHG